MLIISRLLVTMLALQIFVINAVIGQASDRSVQLDFAAEEPAINKTAADQVNELQLDPPDFHIEPVKPEVQAGESETTTEPTIEQTTPLASEANDNSENKASEPPPAKIEESPDFARLQAELSSIKNRNIELEEQLEAALKEKRELEDKLDAAEDINNSSIEAAQKAAKERDEAVQEVEKARVRQLEVLSNLSTNVENLQKQLTSKEELISELRNTASSKDTDVSKLLSHEQCR